MRDRNTINVVYTGIDTDWVDDETIVDISKTGYRLPSSNEWEYAARYRGENSNNTVIGYNNPYYTKGDSASDADAYYYDEAVCQAVAVYSGTIPQPTDEAVVKSLGTSSANPLGLYDMSGNVWEWCFTEDGTIRIHRGGGWIYEADNLRVGLEIGNYPMSEFRNLGFRLCRTAD